MWPTPATLIVYTFPFFLYEKQVVSCSRSEGQESYVSENILRMWSMSHLGDIGRTWTDAVHCPPGSFITAYKLDYGEQFGYYLQHMALACTQLLKPEEWPVSSRGTSPTKVLNVGVKNVNYTANDMGSFVSSESSYAIGASYSRYKREFKGETGVGSRVADMEILFHGWSSTTTTASPSSLSIKVEPPIAYWIEDEISYAICTKGFALCGVRAEVHKAEMFTNVEGKILDVKAFTMLPLLHMPLHVWSRAHVLLLAHIRRLEFSCCYICSPERLYIPLLQTNPPETTQAVLIPLGLEFAKHNPDESRDDDDAYYLENFASSVSDTFDETFERNFESLPSYVSSSSRNPPSISHPLLKYRHSLPISVHLQHSSFGSEIIIHPESKFHATSGPSLPFVVQSGNYSCYMSVNLTQRANHLPAGSPSWNGSAILRTIRHGAMMVRAAFSLQRQRIFRTRMNWSLTL